MHPKYIKKLVLFIVQQNAATRRRVLYAYIATIIFLVAFPFKVIGIEDLDKVMVVRFRLDHLIHIAAFFTVYPLLAFAFPSVNKWQLFLLALAFSILTEGLQHFLPYRSFNTSDMLANLLGMLAGWFLLFLAEKSGWFSLSKLKA